MILFAIILSLGMVDLALSLLRLLSLQTDYAFVATLGLEEYGRYDVWTVAQGYEPVTFRVEGEDSHFSRLNKLFEQHYFNTLVLGTPNGWGVETSYIKEAARKAGYQTVPEGIPPELEGFTIMRKPKMSSNE